MSMPPSLSCTVSVTLCEPAPENWTVRRKVPLTFWFSLRSVVLSVIHVTTMFVMSALTSETCQMMSNGTLIEAGISFVETESPGPIFGSSFTTNTSSMPSA